MRIGIAFFTEIVGAGPSRNCDILGIAMFDFAEIRIHPTVTGIRRLGTKSQGRATRRPTPRSSQPNWGRPPISIAVEESNTDTRHGSHLRIALNSGVGRRDRDGVPQDQGQARR